MNANEAEDYSSASFVPPFKGDHTAQCDLWSFCRVCAGDATEVVMILDVPHRNLTLFPDNARITLGGCIYTRVVTDTAEGQRILWFKRCFAIGELVDVLLDVHHIGVEIQDDDAEACEVLWGRLRTQSEQKTRLACGDYN